MFSNMTLCHACRSYSSAFYKSMSDSTIFALATGGLRSALAVVRVSGPKCSSVLQDVGKLTEGRFPQPRQASLRKLYDPKTCTILDHGIVLWFPGPRSYTGEDCCEFHIHGGPAVVKGVLSAIGSIPGCRIAEPGEFTKRAFINGKMDLTEVDGLSDLISAETEMQRISALKQMSGSLGKIYTGWRNRLAKCLANSEAFADFGEDQSLEESIMEKVVVDVEDLLQEILTHLTNSVRGQRLRQGVRVAIIGEPNVGKSSLLNQLCGRDAAIVSNIPGTTRDVVESYINIQGFPCCIADTAGIRDSSTDTIENEGIRRSLNELLSSDLILLVVDASQHPPTSNSENYDFLLKFPVINDFISSKNFSIDAFSDKTILVENKVDLMPSSETTLENDSDDRCRISCKTGKGMERMNKLIRARIIEICGDPSVEAPQATHERYRMELERCAKHLEDFLNFEGQDLALKIHHLKGGINALGCITGHVGREEVLDIIFRDFCIGK